MNFTNIPNNHKCIFMKHFCSWVQLLFERQNFPLSHQLFFILTYAQNFIHVDSSVFFPVSSHTPFFIEKIVDVYSSLQKRSFFFIDVLMCPYCVHCRLIQKYPWAVEFDTSTFFINNILFYQKLKIKIL